MTKKKKSSRIGYMCQVDYDWELGEALGGTEVYCSVEDLKKERKCVKNCGIVKVKVTLEECVQKEVPWSDRKVESK
jgi:hypothetical protein